MRQPFWSNRSFLDNLIWFAGSLILAFAVWVIATFQSDPIQQQRFPSQVPVRLAPDAGMLITSPPESSRLASVVIRAPRSVLALLTREEIEVWGDLTGLRAGEHLIDLRYRLDRPQASIVDMSPNRVRVTLEEAAEKQVPLQAIIAAEPPAGYAREEPTFDLRLNQILVTGAASKVNRVTTAEAELDLSQQRNPIRTDVRLVPVDADGNVVADVTLDPSVINVSVNIRRRDDVREVSVRPNIRGVPPSGYVLQALSYQPQVVLVSGSPGQLGLLPDTLSTEAIDLRDKTTSFEVSVPVILPDRNLLLLSDPAIAVSVEIAPVAASRQFERVTVETIGLPEGYSARLAPAQVSVLVTGAQPILDTLRASDIRVTLDLNGLAAGNYTLKPTVSLVNGQVSSQNISVLPAEIDVELTGPTLNTTPPTG